MEKKKIKIQPALGEFRTRYPHEATCASFPLITFPLLTGKERVKWRCRVSFVHSQAFAFKRGNAKKGEARGERERERGKSYYTGGDREDARIHPIHPHFSLFIFRVNTRPTIVIKQPKSRLILAAREMNNRPRKKYLNASTGARLWRWMQVVS